jgi:hypothetical protein
MTPNELRTETLILFALAKAFSEQSTQITGTLRHKTNQTFNSSVKQIDLFIKTIEEKLQPGEQEYIQGITDIYHNVNLEIRKEAKKILEQAEGRQVA